jgi:hypothetical protein
MWGAVMWMVSQLMLSTFLTGGAAFAISTIACLAAGAALFARVAELRTRVRALSVVRIADYPDERAAAQFTELKSIFAALCHADAQRDRGRCSPADHEAAWWRSYDRLGQFQFEPVRG